MDISDKNFKPCPCGYQICQFCYNNIRQNPELNGRCPGCRRLYDDESVEYTKLTAEEYKTQQLKKEKREREKKQREKEKKELEIASKKHLAGLRVVQKNLVYVTGLNPPCPPEDLHSVLRLDKYFGQYGRILKIVINRKAPASHGQNHSIVVYVTFTKKEDALRCISELDGSLCDGRVLRAAHGTTKYCLSYLRGHPCPNPNCMFLHEPGEEADSYTRKDLLTQQGIKMGMSGQTTGVNLSYFGETDSEDEHDTQVHTPGQTQVQVATGAASSQTPVLAAHVPVLPATAHWAKSQAAAELASASPSVPNVPVANAAAFPTLGEIFKEQKQKKDAKKPKKRDGNLLPDDVDIDDNSAVQFAEDTCDRLRTLAESKRTLKVYFDDLDTSNVLPFFHFDEAIVSSTTLDEEKVLARQIIERFLLRPIKKYHLAYQNHPISQQQQFLHQQAQLQTPLVSRMQQMSMEQVPDVQQQQQQQQLLLLQQLQAQKPQTPQFPSQLNALRLSERSKTATPPPPGLFGHKAPDTQQPVPVGNQSSSSQLLTQLMSGKK